ncbi:MAG: hypothetical protein IJ722_00995 [Alloprevotella sp.]|nr:hypothetical protein [Alloprevotella sp.]
MDENMKLNDALSADVRAAETGADAAPKREKKYVTPVCRVFHLGAGLLQSSMSTEPVIVSIRGTVDHCYYDYDGYVCEEFYLECEELISGGSSALQNLIDKSDYSIGGIEDNVYFHNAPSDWGEASFLDDAEFDDCGTAEEEGYDFSGTYRGQRFFGYLI